ncbi:MAG: RHS repeat-associated core domain-containing protein [Myxococcaceae bacterium]
MLDPKKTYFKATSSVLVALTGYFLCGREYSVAYAAQASARERLKVAARNLSLDERQLTEPEAFRAAEKLAAEQRRARALAELARYSGATDQAAKASAVRAAALAIQSRQPNAKLERALSRGKALGLPKEVLKAEAVKAKPALAPALLAASRKKPGPGPTPVFSPERQRPPRMLPQQPRPGPGGTRGELTPELRRFYAGVAGEGVFVPEDDGSLSSVEEKLLGVIPPPVRLASVMSDLGLGLPVLGVLPAPAAEDLAETPETKRSPELAALAQSLGGRPVALYNWVHNKVAPELYYGSKKGAAATLEELSGNDFDQASLLIALLRASGIPARYEYGAVLLSADQALSLTGAKDLAGAAYMLSKTGPAALSSDGKAVQVERAWVRAYVGYGDYRGTGPGGEKLWVRLDPGLKQAVHTPAVDLKGLAHFDFASYLSGLDDRTPVEIFEGQLLAAARSQNRCNTLDAALSQATITQADFRLLPAEHPAKVLQSLLVFARPPATMRHSVEISLDQETATFELAELQGRSLSLRYPGATPLDEAAIAAAGGVVGVTPYQVRVAPSLRIDGIEAMRFTTVGPGTSQQLSVRVTVPGGDPALAVHDVVAGSVYALVVNAGTVPASRVAALAKATQGLSGEALWEAQSQHALAVYAREVEAGSRRVFALQGHGAMKDVLEGLAGRRLSVNSQFGLPVSLAQGDYLMDIRREALTPLPMDGDASLVLELVRLSGHHGSALEHKAWETALSSRAVSAVRIIQASASQSVPVYRLTPASNADRAKLTGYSASTLSDVDQALAAKWNVTIPERPINYLTYQNVEGYILENPVDGSGAFMIGTALNGGECDGRDAKNGSGDNKNGCSCDEKDTNSTVDLASSNLRETYTDLTLPGVGLPIVFARTYASRAAGMTELGYGWMHSYGVFLRSELDGSLTFVTNDWREARFTKQAGAWVCAPGWHFTLSDVAGGHRLRTKDGVVYEFDTAGKLTAISEPSGNRVELVYQSGLLSQVKDSGGAVALSFAHQGGHISQVTDRAGRTVSYAYQGDDLISATDVLGKAETYGYDSAHNLTRRTDKLGKVWLEFYDFQDRWVGFRDPLGNEASASYDFVNLRAVYVDATGAAWLREHNAAGNPTALVDPLGNRQEQTWDADFNKKSEKDARGCLTSMAYDAAGNQLSRTEPDGRVTTQTYEAAFNRVLKTSSTGLPTTTNTYDAAGRLKTRSDGLGTTSYGYDARGQLSTVTAPGASVTAFAYDSSGNVHTVTGPTLGVTTLGYDSAGHLTSTLDANANSRTLEVDPAGRVTAMVDATGGRSEFTYDALGNRKTATDAAGGVTHFEYDAAGRLVQTTDAKGNVSTTEYDAEGRVTGRTDARGFKTVLRYDAAGRVKETVAPDGAVTTAGYCASVAEACAVVDAEGRLTTKEFDSVGRVTSVTDAAGRQTVRGFDSAGRLRTSSGPNQPPTTYGYAASGLLSTVTTPTGWVTYGYDARGNRTSVVAQNAQTTSYVYDASNRLLSETNPLGIPTAYTYDAAGNRETKTDGNGQVTRYGYDANRRLTTVTFADGSLYRYGYNVRGSRTLEEGPSHQRALLYDELGRVKQVTDVTLGRTLSFGYDAAGNRTSLTEGNLVYGYGYDGLNRLRRVTDGSGQSTVLDYRPDGRRSAVARPNGVKTTYGYDEAGQVTSIVHAKGAAVLAGFAYGYDGHGNRVSKTREDGSQETYTYDAGDRLIQADYGATKRVGYVLDALGNRLNQTTNGVTNSSGTFNNFNQLKSLIQWTQPATTTAYGYDRSGNLLSETTGAAVKSYTWDLDNRLRAVTLPGGGGVSSYEYDANGLRVKKVEGGVVTRFVLDGASVFEELDSLGNTTTSYLTNPQAIDEILSFTTGGATYYPLTDALGSIVAISDANGLVVRSNSYDVYGEETTSGTGVQTAFGFAGREHDASGLNYYRDREMDPETGRWLQPDRARDGVNLYQYVGGQPTMAVDPFGEKAVLVVGFDRGREVFHAPSNNGVLRMRHILGDNNRDSYARAIEAEVRQQRSTFMQHSTPFRTEVVESVAEFIDLAYRVGEEGGYDEFYFSGHSSRELDRLSLRWIGNATSWLTYADVVSFISIALSQRSAAGLFGCGTYDPQSHSGLAFNVGAAAGMAVVGTDANVTEDLYFANGGYSDQVERAKWSGANLWRLVPP